MRKIILLLFLLSSFGLIAQDNLTYETEKKHTVKIGKYKYSINIERSYYPEGKEASFSEVLIKGNRKQYIAHFLYQLKSSTEMHISPHNPPPIQIENRIVQSYVSSYDEKKEQIVVTTYYYDEKEPKEKEIKIFQQSKKGFFYVRQKQVYFKNGEMKEEKDLPKKIEFVDVDF